VRGPVMFEWFEDWKHLGRSATLQVGQYASDKPRPWLRVRVTNQPSAWRKPLSTSVHVEIGRNRAWTMHLTAHGERYV
jgi:hypothetical protein